MKSNVDLTENRDFRKINPLSLFQASIFDDNIFHKSVLRLISKKEYPWNIRTNISPEVYTPENINGMIICGDKEHRRKIKRYLEGISHSCDCCGKKLHFEPSNFTLCSRCTEKLEAQLKTSKW